MQLQVAANSASGVAHITQGHGARVKALLTLWASPWNNATNSQRIIYEVAAPGAAASVAMASRANHYVQSKITKKMILYSIIYE